MWRPLKIIFSSDELYKEWLGYMKYLYFIPKKRLSRVVEGRVIDTCDELVDVDILNNYSWSEFEVLQEPNKDRIVDFQQKKILDEFNEGS